MKQSNTIRFRMIALTVMVVASMSALGFSGYYTFHLVQERIGVAELLGKQTTSLLTILRGITEIVLIPDNPQTVKHVREEVSQFGRNLDLLLQREDDRKAQEILATRIRPEWQSIEKEVAAFLRISRPNPEDVDTMITFGKLSANTDKLLKLMTELRSEANQRSGRYILSMTLTMGVVAVALIVITAAVLTSIFRSIALPLEEISRSAEQISHGKLTVELSVKRKDEIGILAESFRHMVANLRRMISQAAGVSAEVNQASAAISKTSGQVLVSVDVQNRAIEDTARSVEEVDQSITKLQANSSQLFNDATTTSSAATELAASISQVAANAAALDSNTLTAVRDLEEMVATSTSIVESVEQLSRFAEETCLSMEQIGTTVRTIQENADQSVVLADQVSRSASDQGLSAIRDAVEGIHNIRHSVSSLSEVVNRLGTKSMQIGKIITVIDDIASQTRLLALNASILAAQAGPHGRSFGVVALEIRSLAERTFLSTQEIVEVITSVQTEASSSIKMANSGMEAVQKGITLIDRVQGALEGIHKNSLASTEMSRAISKETASEVEVINRISQSIVMLRDQIDEISRAVGQQSESTGDMNRLMEQIKVIAREIAVVTRDQADTSRQISQIADNLMHHSQDIDLSIGIQKRKSDTIVAAIASMHETAGLLAQSARTMEQAAQSLGTKAATLSGSINSFEV